MKDLYLYIVLTCHTAEHNPVSVTFPDLIFALS